MELFVLLMIFIMGTIFGSFFNVVGYRLPKGESIVYPPSHCPKCKRNLKPLELIPIISWLFQKGTCKNCKQKIGLFYPIFEFITGAMFVLNYIVFGPTLEFGLGLIFISSLIIIIISDYQTMIIPDEIIILTILSMVVYSFISKDTNVFIISLNGFISGAIMFSIKTFGDHLFKKESMGGGDIKLLFVFGMYLGFELAIITIFLSSFLALPYSIYVVKVKKSNIVPYGPFLAIAAAFLFLIQTDFLTIITILA